MEEKKEDKKPQNSNFKLLKQHSGWSDRAEIFGGHPTGRCHLIFQVSSIFVCWFVSYGKRVFKRPHYLDAVQYIIRSSHVSSLAKAQPVTDVPGPSIPYYTRQDKIQYINYMGV